MNSFGLYIYGLISNILPETRCFGLKRFLLRCSGARIGKDVRICSSTRFLGSGTLSIGDDTWIGHQCLILSSSNIIIGNNCDIAPKVYISTGTHIINKHTPHVAGDGVRKDIIIHDGSWLCANATILPGVEIGSKSIVAAGAVVTKSCGSGEIIGGVPAALLKYV